MKLGVNIDHVATLRQARKGREPDPAAAAAVCRRAGAHSVVMHLREDRRHIQDSDLFRVKESVPIRLNLEMSVWPSVVKVAARLLPDQVTLVPERREEMTTESGLDLFRNQKKIKNCIEAMKKKNAAVSLFVDTDPRQLEEALEMGADAVEFHTGRYAAQKSARGVRREFGKLKKCASMAKSLGLVPHAGHGLDYANVSRLKAIPELEELNIGYSIVCRALWVGFESAVKEMLELVR